jgi:hypothetical protein
MVRQFQKRSNKALSSPDKVKRAIKKNAAERLHFSLRRSTKQRAVLSLVTRWLVYLMLRNYHTEKLEQKRHCPASSATLLLYQQYEKPISDLKNQN